MTHYKNIRTFDLETATGFVMQRQKGEEWN